tara:strand:+ start:251 stop:523 length:273 start_codon:yes stop_codon:yes gene_type:complete
MKKRGKEKTAATQEAVFTVLNGVDGNMMLCSDLVELVNNYFAYTINGKAMGMFLRKQVNAGFIVKSKIRCEGYPELYWKLDCDSLEEFVK